MIAISKNQLAKVFWIGGSTDSGKSTVAQNLSQRLGMPLYHYDRYDAQHTERLADRVSEVSQFLKCSLEERWVHPTPEMMFDYLLAVFPHRFQLVMEDLLEKFRDQFVIVEGFGLLPGFVDLIVSSRFQAIWFVSTEQFKWESMTRRGKPSFAGSLSNPQKAKINIFNRDMLLAAYYREQAAFYGYTLHEIDGSRSPDESADLVQAHFAKYLATLTQE